MSMKKAFDQTIRDIKREVNKKVLKVPSVEQKVLDATSNEPWGPHGSLLADIANATRNYHEHQMIMAVLWKRINDTGKNWRHVYKALTVLEYLVAHGSERVIDDIREHAYQISTLSEFQYIDSSGRDQGNNVRRKSQSLVVLVNDKERIQEAREKAASNRDKFRNSSAVGGMYRPGSGGYGDDRYEGRYGGRDDDRNGNGREKDWGYRDDGRYGDSYSREGDRYGRDTEDHYGRDSYRDDDSRGRSRSVDGYGSRGRSSEREAERTYDEDDRRSSRESSVRAEDHATDGRRLERKFSEQNLGAPPSYEEAVGVSRSPTFSERDGETSATAAPQMSSPTAGSTAQSPPSVASAAQSSAHVASATQSSPPNNVNPSQSPVEHVTSTHSTVQTDVFDEFDPRGSISVAAPSSSNPMEMDLLGSLSDAFSPAPLAIMPASSGPVEFETDASNSASNPTFGGATFENNTVNQSFEDPFGDSPFKAIPSDEPAKPQNFTSTTSFQPAVNSLERTQSGASNQEFPGVFPGSTYHFAGGSNEQSPSNPQFFPEQHSLHDDDILAGILPPSGPASTTAAQSTFPTSAIASESAFPASTGQPPAGYGFMPHAGPTAASPPHMASHNMVAPPVQLTQQNSHPFSAPSTNQSSNIGLGHTGMASHQNNDFLGGVHPQAGSTLPPASQSPSASMALALVPQQPAEKKFETKSTVWADTLNRGLVNLNISGSKINPLSDIGIDFESLNRKEKRMEKPTTAPATSNVSMGKAMGSGTGIGRAGAGALRPQNQMMGGSGMGMGGMGMAGSAPGGIGMPNYGSMNQQPMGMGGMGMNMGGMGMNMGMGRGVTMQPPMGQGMPMQTPMGQGMPMQPSNGLAPGSNMNGFNPMMGRGGYPQQPYQYGGGYR